MLPSYDNTERKAQSGSCGLAPDLYYGNVGFCFQTVSCSVYLAQLEISLEIQVVMLPRWEEPKKKRLFLIAWSHNSAAAQENKAAGSFLQSALSDHVHAAICGNGRTTYAKLFFFFCRRWMEWKRNGNVAIFWHVLFLPPHIERSSNSKETVCNISESFPCSCMNRQVVLDVVELVSIAPPPQQLFQENFRRGTKDSESTRKFFSAE